MFTIYITWLIFFISYYDQKELFYKFIFSIINNRTLMKYKTIIILIALAIVASGAYYYFSNNKTKDIQWRTAKAQKGDISIIVNTTGSLQADTTVDVGTQVSGTIAKLYVDYNSKVKKGQLVALIDTTTLAAQVDNAKASLKSAEAQQKLAQENFKRTQKLFAKNLVAKSTYDQDKVNLEVAKSNVEVDKARVKSAQLNLDHATIYAPISGVVINKNVSVGQTVAASFNTPTLFTIANDLTKMQVQADIDEADIGQVKVGQPVDFTVDAYPDDTFHGKVKQIRLNPTTTNNVVTYTVIIDVRNPDLKLMPGMTANISIKTAESKNVIKVPAMALQFKPPQSYLKSHDLGQKSSMKGKQSSNNGQQAKPQNSRQAAKMPAATGLHGQKIFQPGDHATIWLKNANNIKQVHVTLGLSDGSFTAVKGNIQAGDNVIIGAILPSQNQIARSPFSRRR